METGDKEFWAFCPKNGNKTLTQIFQGKYSFYYNIFWPILKEVGP